MNPHLLVAAHAFAILAAHDRGPGAPDAFEEAMRLADEFVAKYPAQPQGKAPASPAGAAVAAIKAARKGVP